MNTPPSPSASSARPPADEQDELWNLLLLQTDAVRLRFREFHQQIELFIQHTNEHPLTGVKPMRAAHDSLPLRDRTTPAAAAPMPLVSDAVASLVRDLCAPSGAVRDASAMAQLTKKLDGDASLTVDDKAQLLFVLDASFAVAPATSATAAILLSAFEKDGGYGVLMSWFETSCSYSDEPNKALSRLLLQFLERHRPALPFSRKTVLLKLRSTQAVAVGRKNRTHLKEMIDKYQANK
jgi:hypothetical protein